MKVNNTPNNGARWLMRLIVATAMAGAVGGTAAILWAHETRLSKTEMLIETLREDIIEIKLTVRDMNEYLRAMGKD